MPASDQGVLAGRYTLVPRTLIFLTRGEHLLLIKGAPQKRLWANLYNGVGGHVERGEDVLSAAHRELAEETGLSVSEIWLCGVITIDTGENIGVGIYVLRGNGDPVTTPPKPSKEGTLEWVPIKQVTGLPLVEDLNILLPRVLAMQPGDPPFSAHFSYDELGKLLISFGN